MQEPAKLVVVGQGYVGLPLAVRAAEAGYSVVGIDLDSTRVQSLTKGASYVDDVSDAVLTRAIASGRYVATDDYELADYFDFAVVTVPTPLKESLPDLTFIESAAQSLGEHLGTGATVVLESTTYPGTTQELFVPLLERASGLRAGPDFHVGYSPERIDPGNSEWSFTTTPKVVSGIDGESLSVISEFYGSIVDRTVPVSSPKEAELTKLLENTFRHVNIALVNELAIFAHQLGVNLWEAIDAAETKPFGFMKFTPGPGVGGHCLPVDPSYLSWQVRRRLGQNFRFVELANDINDHMPDYVTQRLMTILNTAGKPLRGSTVLIVGLAYKKNTGDIREAPSLRLINLLVDFGATVIAVDDHVEDHRWPNDVAKVSLTDDVVKNSDIAVLMTDHDDIGLDSLASLEIPVLDTKNVLSGPTVDRL